MGDSGGEGLLRSCFSISLGAACCPSRSKNPDDIQLITLLDSRV